MTTKQSPYRRRNVNGTASSNGLTSMETDPSIRQTDRLGKSGDDSRILIVDDDHLIVEMVAKMVAVLGYRPTVALDGVDALDCMRDTHYRVVITDYSMPFMDGYQLAIQVKENDPMTRVIIMTGYCGKDDVDRMENATHVDGVLCKPFTIKQLKEKIEEAAQVGPPPWIR